MTAKYNIYFNGYENYKAGLSKIATNHKDDFAELLNVFEYSDPSTASLCSSDMERALQKASKLISLKSITARPDIKETSHLSQKEKTLLERKEFNEWVDDSYLLIGKARFYKHEYNEASSLFNYSISNANDPDIKTEAAIWLARLDNETKKYSESLGILSAIELNNKTPKSLRAMYYTTLADLNIKQKKYSDAIEPLSKAVELVAGKRTRYRLTFLLAQLFEKDGNAGMATKNFQKVINMHPPYEVEFYARINIAGVFDVNAMDPVKIKRELEKMLKDLKNNEFQDQIYYALGNLAMKAGNEKEALENYHKSASVVSQNQNQRGRSFLALASYYFSKSDFLNSGMYYDSTVYFLDPSFPEYKDIVDKSQNLNTLVSQLKIIQREDSLQKVAKMNEPQRNALIASLIAKATKEETERKSTDYTDRYNLGQFYENERRSQGNIQQEGKWYFYNQAALAFGRTEFRRRWGDRKLEDNWRRSNKARVTTMQFAGTEETEQQRKDTSAAVSNIKKPEFYLKNLPLTDSLMAISNEKVGMALLNAGKAYSEKLNDAARATQTLELLIQRFPASDLLPETMYNLYKINKTENSAKAEIYRQRLLKEFPESEFARILSDPGYYEKKMAEMKLAEKTYDEAYKAYSEERFRDAILLCTEGMQKFPQDQLAPKFLLLHAYATARISDEKKFMVELNNIIKSWPNTPESKKAMELVTYLNQKTPELKVEADKQIAAELYKADTAQVHLFALIIPDPTFNINLATFDVISYNIDNYTNKNYRTEGTLTPNKYIMITVSGFSNYAQALDYYNKFNIVKIVRNSSSKKMITFIIDNDNLKILNKDGDPERYQIFFREKYLK